MRTMAKWSAQHYNALAKEIRDLFPIYEVTRDVPESGIIKDSFNAAVEGKQDVLMNLMISLCYRFIEDNPRFDPVKFLNACSPIPGKYKFGEMWEIATKEAEDNV